MKYTRLFKFTVHASASLLSAVITLWIGSYLLRDEVPFQSGGVRYRVCSWQGIITIDNQPQVDLETARNRKVLALVERYRKAYRDHTESHRQHSLHAEYAYWRQSERILTQLERVGRMVFPPEGPAVFPVTSAVVMPKVRPFPTDAAGQPVFYAMAHATSTPPMSYTIPYSALAFAAALLPAILLVRALSIGYCRRREICARCGHDIHFMPSHCPACGYQTASESGVPASSSRRTWAPWVAFVIPTLLALLAFHLAGVNFPVALAHFPLITIC